VVKTSPKSIKSWLITLVALGVVIPVVWVLVVRLEGEKPTVQFDLTSPWLGPSRTLSFSFSDPKSGLRSLWIGIVQDGKEIVLLQRSFPGSGFLGGGRVGSESVSVGVEPKSLGISEGKATLRVTARDYSWRGRFRGNLTLVEKEVTIDTRAPSIAVLTRFHNVAQGGAGLVIYRISEPCPRSGVFIGEHYFPGYSGYFKDPQIGLAFFALAHDQDPGVKMFVQAQDSAGNQSVAGFPKYIIKKRFPKDTVGINDGFLEQKMPEFECEVPFTPGAPLVDVFLKVNQDLRKANYRKIVEVVGASDPGIHWEGPFLRLPNAARRASFADRREYLYNGKIIDHQVHMGIDLASLAQSPVPASNTGRVAFTGRIGIYGNTVIIDHGFGLFSMYSHLSDIGVEKDQKVSKGDVIGRTGTTGLAGGDHLHYGILIHDVFVNPVEWWDGSWIENNVSSKIREVQGRAG